MIKRALDAYSSLSNRTIPHPQTFMRYTTFQDVDSTIPLVLMSEEDRATVLDNLNIEANRSNMHHKETLFNFRNEYAQLKNEALRLTRESEQLRKDIQTLTTRKSKLIECERCGTHDEIDFPEVIFDAQVFYGIKLCEKCLKDYVNGNIDKFFDLIE